MKATISSVLAPGVKTSATPRPLSSSTASASSLDHGLDDLLGRLVQAGVDDLHAGVAERAR
jgi:hypothetical protein